MIQPLNTLDRLLQDASVVALKDKGEFAYIYSSLNFEQPSMDQDVGKVLRFAHLLLVSGYSMASGPDRETSKVTELLSSGYYLLRTLPIKNQLVAKEFESLLGVEGVDTYTSYFFLLATAGLLSGNCIKARLDLRCYELDLDDFRNLPWKQRVVSCCMASLIYLIRKSNGLVDVHKALEMIEQLRLDQAQYEAEYLGNVNEEGRVPEAYRLLGCYHLAKVLTELATYLVRGYDYSGNLDRDIDRHSRMSSRLLGKDNRLGSIAATVCVVASQLQKNSIWFRTQGWGHKIEALCRHLAKKDILDLLPSQSQALEQNLMDMASNVTVVQMPTSAGKTLLAEMAILQTKALRDDAKIVYIVPTKALANQMLHDLRSDFAGMGFSIEKTSSANEVDPTEDLFLREEIDILISTPEKLDLLVRRGHSSARDLALIVVDEAHNIRDGERGARLELLMSMLKRERPRARFLLLSPFLPNADDLKAWLAGGRSAISPIKVDWAPSDKLFAGISQKQRKCMFHLMPSAQSFSAGLRDERVVDMAKSYKCVSNSGTKKRLMEIAARHFDAADQSVLYLCWGKKSADKHAQEIASYLSRSTTDEDVDLVARYAEDEFGGANAFSNSLRQGVAVHHAGLTDECRRLVEYLIRNNKIKHVCSTTTIAQGINFPISVVYMDDTRKGRDGRLSVNEFRNIAGRAGRTLMDTVGKVIFPFNSKENRDVAHEFVASDASDITSALAHLAANADVIINAFSGNDEKLKANLLYKDQTLLPLLQYMVHLLTVAEEGDYADQLEQLFMDSFGYHSLGTKEEKQKFVELCNVLYSDMSRRNRGVLKFADKTGFSVPSILRIMNSKRDDPSIAEPAGWEPDVMFGTDVASLTEKIAVIGQLREVELGTDSDAAPFSPEMVARILVGWVKGENISELAGRHPYFRKKENSDKMNDFVSYLTRATFRSSWGLSVLEGVVKNQNDELAPCSYVPSMVYYGVSSKEAVGMRMLGYPRTLASALAKSVWGKIPPKTFSEVRGRISSLSEDDWNRMKPTQSRLAGAEWKKLSMVLAS